MEQGDLAGLLSQTSVLSSFLSMGKWLGHREGRGLRWTDGLMLNICSPLFIRRALLFKKKMTHIRFCSIKGPEMSG